MKEGRGEGEGRRIRKIKQDGHSIHEKHEMLGTGHHGVCHFSGPCILQVAYNVLFVSVVLSFCFFLQDEFAEYSRAQRVRIKWETKLREVERPYKSNLFLYTSIARTVSVILIVSMPNFKAQLSVCVCVCACVRACVWKLNT